MRQGNNKEVKKIKKVFALAWGISPLYIILLIMNSLIGAMQIVANVVLPKYLIDELITSRNTQSLFYIGGAIVLSNLLFSFLGKLMTRNLAIQNRYMNEKMNQALGIKIMNVDYSYLENPYYLDLKERAAFACTNQSAVYNLINNSADLLKSLVTLVSMVAIMLTLGPVLFLVSAVTIILTVVVLASFSSYQVFEKIIPVNRKYGYYLGLGYSDDEIQKDARLYGMEPMLLSRVVNYTNEFMGEFNKYYKKQGKIRGAVNIIANLQAALTYGYVGIRVVTKQFGKQIGLGSFMMYVNASIQFTATFRTLTDNIVGTKQMLDYLDPFLELMDLPEVKQEGDIPFEGDIESVCFEHVTFCYPGSEKEVLSDLSFQINKGEKISIVGLNGAGKTTLIKLICRLYHPTSGKILINGKDIFDYDYESYIKNIAAVFQDYKLFAFSLLENITSKDKEKVDKGEVNEIVKEVGLEEKIEELPNGLDSLYGKAYDVNGIELSGGQSQKVAIARALYKNASMVIMDEPTSALDPLAEADIYHNFNNMVSNKTAIYISHRMSSSVFCDRILVLDGGSVSDFDSHENLMKKGESLYCKLFKAQAENYSEA